MTAVVEQPVETSAEDLALELSITQQQLDVLGEYFLLALAQLPDNTLTVSLSEQALLGELPLALQAKSDDHGNVIFRAVEVK